MGLRKLQAEPPASDLTGIEAGGPVEPVETEEAAVGRLLQEARLLTENTCFEGTVERIELGFYGSFVPPPRDDRLRESYERRRNRLAYRFTISTPVGTVTDVLVISANPASRMARLAKCYNTIKVGQRVKVCVENGKLRISC